VGGAAPCVSLPSASRVEAARGDAVDSNARGELTCQGSRKRSDGRSQHVRCVKAIDRLAYGGGGHEEQGGAVPHEGQKSPNQAYRPAEKQLVRGLPGRIIEREDVPAWWSAGVYEGAVDAIWPVLTSGDGDARGSFRCGEISRARVSIRPQLRTGGLEPGGVACDQEDLGAARNELTRQSQAKAVASAYYHVAVSLQSGPGDAR
jgi:hypothetical protein